MSRCTTRTKPTKAHIFPDSRIFFSGRPNAPRISGILIILCALAFAEGEPSAAGTDTALWAYPDFRFAESLASERDYFRAVTFYKKAAFDNPGDAVLGAQCMLRIGICCTRAEQTPVAMQYLYRAITGYPGQDEVVSTAKLAMGIAKFGGKMYTSALQDFEAFIVEYPASPLIPQAHVYQSLTQLLTSDWQGGKTTVQNLATRFPGTDYSALADSVLPIVNQTMAIRLKSPLAAGLLSTFVPGAGQLYAERHKDAITIFVIEALLAYATVYAVTQPGVHDSYGYISGSLFTLFHLTNIYGAVNAAQNANKLIEYNQLESVRRRVSPVIARFPLVHFTFPTP